jgi:hypothetical protein
MTSHAALVERLSDISARRPRDPFLTIPWDDPDHAIDPAGLVPAWAARLWRALGVG